MQNQSVPVPCEDECRASQGGEGIHAAPAPSHPAPSYVSPGGRPSRPRLSRLLFRCCLPGLLATGLLTFLHHAAQAQATAPEGEAWVAESGTASFYGYTHRGRRTASGGRFDPNRMTGAHPWLPFGTRVRVTVAATGRSVVVTITDRMNQPRRVIDLSAGAARQLGILQQGLAQVLLSPT
jgi:rare lipoprotein A